MSSQREIYIQEIIRRPVTIALERTESDHRVLANDISDDHRGRLEINHDGSTNSYMVGNYNGHSKPVAPSDDSELIRRPTYCTRGENWAEAASILRQ